MVVLLWLEFLLTFSFAVFLLFFKTKNTAKYWYSGFVFSLALGLLASILDPNPTGKVAEVIEPLKLLARFMSALSFRLCPFTLIMAGISVSQIVLQRRLKTTTILLILPVIVSFGSDFTINIKNSFIYRYLDYSPLFWIEAVWVVPYTLIANSLVIYSIFKEKMSKARFQKVLLAIITIFSLYPMYISYLAPVLHGWHNFFIDETIFPLFLIFAFLICASMWGLFGTKITFQEQFFSIYDLMNETTVLNQSLANNMDRIQSEIDSSTKYNLNPEIKKIFDNISNIIDQSSIVIKKIKEKTNIIVTYEETLLQKKRDELLNRFNLTNKEKEIYCYLEKGLTPQEIAERLVVEEKTTRNHIGNIAKKMDTDKDGIVIKIKKLINED